MNEKIKDHLLAYCKKQGFTNADEDLKEILVDGHIYRGDESSHRWWNTYFYVALIDGMYIGYEYAKTTGDSSAEDLGYEFNFDSICEVIKEEKTLTVTTFKRKE